MKRPSKIVKAPLLIKLLAIILHLKIIPNKLRAKTFFSNPHWTMKINWRICTKVLLKFEELYFVSPNVAFHFLFIFLQKKIKERKNNYSKKGRKKTLFGALETFYLIVSKIQWIEIFLLIQVISDRIFHTSFLHKFLENKPQ